jgi:hypothetical protein
MRRKLLAAYSTVVAHALKPHVEQLNPTAVFFNSLFQRLKHNLSASKDPLSIQIGDFVEIRR